MKKNPPLPRQSYHKIFWSFFVGGTIALSMVSLAQSSSPTNTNKGIRESIPVGAKNAPVYLASDLNDFWTHLGQATRSLDLGAHAIVRDSAINQLLNMAKRLGPNQIRVITSNDNYNQPVLHDQYYDRLEKGGITVRDGLAYFDLLFRNSNSQNYTGSLLHYFAIIDAGTPNEHLAIATEHWAPIELGKTVTYKLNKYPILDWKLLQNMKTLFNHLIEITSIVLTEAMINPDDPGEDIGEWVELYNKNASQSFDLTGWTIQDSEAADTIAANTALGGNSTVLAPGKYGVIFDPEYVGGKYVIPSTTLLLAAKGADQDIGGAGLANIGDTITIYDEHGHKASSYTCMDVDAGNGKSRYRLTPQSSDKCINWLNHTSPFHTLGGPN